MSTHVQIIDVIQEDIDRDQHSRFTCPVACAFNRRFPDLGGFRVGTGYAIWDDGDTKFILDLPGEVTEAIITYDTKGGMTPFSFPVSIQHARRLF